jgi:heavy metal sensor kinase
MRFPRSIRWRLQLWYGALFVAVVCGFGFTAFHLESARQLHKIDEGLQVRLSTLVDALRAGPDRERERDRQPDLHLKPEQSGLFGDEAGHYYLLWMRGKEPTLRSPNAPTGVPKPDSHTVVVRTRGDLREAFLFAAPVDCLLVGRSIAAEQADLRWRAALFASLGALVLAAGLLGGGWLVTRALRPVEEISTTAAKIATGDLSQRIAVAETDSELGRLAGVLNSTFARLDTAFTQQARFTADAAHELRTPVAVMLTQIQSALTRERTGAEYQETLEACQRATQRMRRLIESLLELARLDAGQEPPRRNPCDLATIAAEGIELIRPLADERHIQIRPGLEPGPCHGDADRLAQVVTNLLSNAVTYNHDGGTIHLTTQSSSGAATLTITNTGPGIPAEDLPHIFERFHRADKARTAGHTGLGLAITKALVLAHGGEIEAESSGERTTFTVRLPA